MMDGDFIVSGYDPGIHATNLSDTLSRLDREHSWKDLSMIILTPTARKTVHPKVVTSWLNLARPPNNKTVWLTAQGLEVSIAYSRAIEMILGHPDLSSWKYLLTVEHDQSIPGDGLSKLLARMEDHPEFAAISGLYFTKGHGGCAQIWGD